MAGRDGRGFAARSAQSFVIPWGFMPSTAFRPWRVAFGTSLLSGLAQIALVRELSAAHAVSSLALSLRLVIAVVLVAFGIGAALVPRAARASERGIFGTLGAAICLYLLAALILLLRRLEPSLAADSLAPSRLVLLGIALAPPFVGYGFVIARLTADVQRDAAERVGAFVAISLAGTIAALVVAHHYAAAIGVNGLLVIAALATPLVLRDRAWIALAVAALVAVSPAEPWLEAQRESRPGWVAPVDPAGVERVFAGWSPFQKIDLYRFEEDVLLGVHNGFWQWWVSSNLDHRYAFPGYRLLYDPAWIADRDVLVIGSGAGMGLLHLERARPRSLTAVEMDPLVLTLARGPFAAFNGHVYDRVESHAHEGRAFLDATDRRFDVIVFEGASLTTAHPRVEVSAESYLYTAEGIARALDRLRPDGIGILVFVGPESAFARIARSLAADGAASAALRLSYPSTLWTHLTAFVFGRDPARITAVADAIVAAADSEERAVRLPIETAGVPLLTDDHPFLYAGATSELAPLAWATAIAAVLGLGMTAAPGARRLRAYYLLLGAGFVFVQYAVFARLRSLFGDPVTTSYTALILLMTGMAIGSAVVPHLRRLGGVRRIAIVALCAALGIGFLVGVPLGTGSGSWLVRAGSVGAAMLPLGMALGVFFPLGLAGRPAAAVPTAFVFDAVGTALGFLAFHLVALAGGLTAALAAGVALYGLAAVVRE